MKITKKKEMIRHLADHGISLGCSVVFRKNEEEWIKGRFGIGGSDASKCLGIHGSQAELWAEKLGYIEHPDISGLEVVKYGKECEKYVAGIYELDHPTTLLLRYPYWSFSNKEHPFLQYTPDGLLIDEKNRLGILEIKTTTIRKSEDWDNWKNDGDICVPDNYFCQVMHGTNVIQEAQFVDLIALIKHHNGSTLRTFHWELSDQEVARQRQLILDYTLDFWKCVEQKSYPKSTLLLRPDLAMAG